MEAQTEPTLEILTKRATEAKAEYAAMLTLTGEADDPLSIIAADKWKAAIGALYTAQGIGITAPWKTHGQLSVENTALRGDHLLKDAEFLTENSTKGMHYGAGMIEAFMCTQLDTYCSKIPVDSGIHAFLQLFRPHLRLIAEQYAGVTKEK